MKPDFPIEKLKKLLESSNQDIIKINPIKFGMTAQAFDCHKKGGNLIFRIGSDKQNLLKDKYAYENFNSSVVPIPKFVSFGKIAPHLYFAVTEKIKGENLQEIDSEQKFKRVLPLMAKILDQIHNISVQKNKGCGLWNAEGFAPYKSWEGFILSIKDSKKYDWKKMINKHGMEQKLIEKVCTTIDHLVKYCPEKRNLIHGDYGKSNLIWDGSKITGIIDWALSKYGDFLYDVAWMDFFSLSSQGKIDYEHFFKNHYQDTGQKIDNYEERMKCYKLRIGLFLARLSLTQGRKKRYQDRRRALLKIMED